ncbi:MAG: hypothetical protein AAB686_00465 [Patescibacteria group bacterium]
MKKRTAKKIAVLYHGDCPDGFAGAWAAWKKFGKRADYLGLTDREKLPTGLRGKEIYMIDWVFDDPRVMEGLCQMSQRVVGIDHYLVSRDIFRKLPGSIFDFNHSGAVLAWSYFHPKKSVPQLLRYVEDYDLWRFRLRGTEAVNAIIESQKVDFVTWSCLVDDFENAVMRRKYISEGRRILEYRDRQVELILKSAKLVRFGGFNVLAVNSPVFRNEIGHILAKRKPPFGIIWREEKDRIHISLRAIKPFNLLKSLKKEGPAGHPQAAGIALPSGAPLPWKEVKSKRKS